MIKASGTQRKLELTSDDIPLTLLDDRKMSFDLGGKTFTITRKGFWSPTHELRCGQDLIAALEQAPLVNRYTVTCSGQVWQLKAEGLTAKKFGLHQNGAQVGTISPVHFDPCREILLDLPPALPPEAQALLLWVVWSKWSDTN